MMGQPEPGKQADGPFAYIVEPVTLFQKPPEEQRQGQKHRQSRQDQQTAGQGKGQKSFRRQHQCHSADGEDRQGIHDQIPQENHGHHGAGDLIPHHKEGTGRLSSRSGGGDGGKIYIPRAVEKPLKVRLPVSQIAEQGQQSFSFKDDESQHGGRGSQQPAAVGLGQHTEKIPRIQIPALGEYGPYGEESQDQRHQAPVYFMSAFIFHLQNFHMRPAEKRRESHRPASAARIPPAISTSTCCLTITVEIQTRNVPTSMRQRIKEEVSFVRHTPRKQIQLSRQ